MHHAAPKANQIMGKKSVVVAPDAPAKADAVAPVVKKAKTAAPAKVEEDKPAAVVKEKPKKTPKHPRKPLTEAQRTGIFKKTVVAISSGACEEGGSGGEYTFTEMKREVTALGADISPTVHKRVAMLLVNEVACSKNTQKVRRAQKFKVPVVRAQDYIKACKAAGEKLPVEEYLATLQE